MNFKLYIVDSLHFTKETFIGNRIRSVIFLLLGIAFGVISLFHTIIPRLDHFIIYWQLMYSWWVWGTLLIIWILTYTIIEGYGIRIFRGSINPPSFDHFKVLIMDGIKAEILTFIWAIPALIWTFVFSSHLVLIIFLVLLILMFPVTLFLFANTGDFWGSLRISKILSVIHNPGWGNYVAAWGIGFISFLIVIIINAIFRIILASIPIIPVPLISAVSLIIFGYSGIFFNVFFIRFFMSVFKNRDVDDSDNTIGRVNMGLNKKAN